MIKLIYGDKELKDARKIRHDVFITEQKVSESDELDGLDNIALHAVLYDEKGMPAAYARLLPEEDGRMRLGRVAVLKHLRGRGYGVAVCRFMIDAARKNNACGVVLEAQLHAVGFYRALGFTEHDGIFYDAGMEHKKMTLEF